MASTQDILIWLILSFWDIKHEVKQCGFLNTLYIMIVYAHAPKLNYETGMVLHACFISELKKENSTNKRARWHML